MSSDGSAEPRSRGLYPKGVARRQEILDRAIEVFVRGGSDHTSLRAIAQEVGVTHAALSHYFGSLEELLVEVYLESGPHNGDLEGNAADRTPIEVMRDSARANRLVPGIVELYTSLVAAALQDGHDAARAFATERFARLRAELAEQVRHHQGTGRIRSDVDPAAVAALVVAASDGLQTQWLLEPTVDEQGALAMLEHLLSGPGEGTATA